MLKKKWFISLGRGMTLNKNLVKDVFQSNGRYIIQDIYGANYVVSKTTYDEVKKIIN